MANTKRAEGFLSPAEAGRLLGLSEALVKQGLINGTLPIGAAVMGGGRYRYVIPSEAVEYFLRHGTALTERW